MNISSRRMALLGLEYLVYSGYTIHLWELGVCALMLGYGHYGAKLCVQCLGLLALLCYAAYLTIMLGFAFKINLFDNIAKNKRRWLK